MNAHRALIATLLAAHTLLAAPALAAPGDLDPSFFNLGLNGTTFATAVLSEGKILVAGTFGGGAGNERVLLARLHADGIRDAAFDPNVSGPESTSVDVVAVQADGKILVGGSARSQLARLHADGTLDRAISITS